MDVAFMPGFRPGPDFVARLLCVAQHFWNRGQPEVTRFGAALTRNVHGADMAVLYYEPGFRSAWFSLKQGQHANADPRDQVNRFASLLVLSRGRASARVGGRLLELKAGDSVMVPAGVPHEVWNETAEPAEGILVMFGSGA